MDLMLFKIGGTWTKAFLKLEDKWRVGLFKIKGAKYIYVYIYIYICIYIYIYIYIISNITLVKILHIDVLDVVLMHLLSIYYC